LIGGSDVIKKGEVSVIGKNIQINLKNIQIEYSIAKLCGEIDGGGSAS
jgi:hypothetical protein